MNKGLLQIVLGIVAICMLLLASTANAWTASRQLVLPLGSNMATAIVNAQSHTGEALFIFALTAVATLDEEGSMSGQSTEQCFRDYSQGLPHLSCTAYVNDITLTPGDQYCAYGAAFAWYVPGMEDEEKYFSPLCRRHSGKT